MCKAIQEILGHANITTTLNVYGHLLPNVLRDATDQVAGLAVEDDETHEPAESTDDKIAQDDEDDLVAGDE